MAGVLTASSVTKYILGTNYGVSGDNTEHFAFRMDSNAVQAAMYNGSSYTASIAGPGVGVYITAFALAGRADATDDWYAGYVDAAGVESISSAVSTAAASNRNARTAWIGCGANNGSVWRFYDNRILWVGVFDGWLSASERRAYAANPWQLYAPTPRRIFWEAVAGGATNLVIAEALHAHAADNLALTQLHLLTVAEASHAHAADNLTLTQLHLLTVAEASHAHAADNLTLTQQHTLVLADALHAHAADNVVLSVLGTLAVNDALHGHTADNLALTQAHQLAVADAVHGHAADNLALTQAHVLAIQEALHAHLADNLTLAIGGTTLAIAEALHAHAADNLALTQLHVLVINDTLHAHLADMLTLELPGAAILHDRVLFIRGETRTLVIVADNRTLTVH